MSQKKIVGKYVRRQKFLPVEILLTTLRQKLFPRNFEILIRNFE